MKRFLSFALVVVMVFSLMPFSAFAANAKITITTQPESQTVAEGSDAVFTIDAVLAGMLNDQRLKYIWVDASAVNFAGMSGYTVAATIANKALGVGKTLALEDVTLDMDGLPVCCIVYTIDDMKSNVTVSNIAFLSVTLRDPCEVHDLSPVEAEPSTCVDFGHTEYWLCNVCHRCYADEAGLLEISRDDTLLEVDPNAHSLEHLERTEPTCVQNGYVEHWKCTLCGSRFDNEQGTGNALSDKELALDKSTAAHKLKPVSAKESTCSTEGNIEHSVCALCGGYFSSDGTQKLTESDVMLPKLPHTAVYENDWLRHWQVCTVCGETVEGSTGFHNDKGCKANCVSKKICECGYEHGNLGDHSYQAVFTQPTCDQIGYTTHTCEFCGDYYIDNYKSAKGHSFGDWIITMKPTCTEAGEKIRYCSVCDGYETARVNPLNHNYKPTVTESTCTEGGYTTYICERCGDHFVADLTDPKGHSYGAWETVKAATCTEQGQEIRYCAYHDSYENRTTDALGHDYGAWQTITAATCTEKGKEIRYCSRCDATETRDTDVLGHDYGAWQTVKAPTCTEKGSAARYCSRCEVFESRELDALGHDYGAWKIIKAPTCTENGTSERYCSRCDAFETREIDALKHDYKAVVTAATCTEDGFTTFTCANCHDSYVGDYVKAKGHDYKDVVTAVTCTEDGFTTCTCANCGNGYVKDVVKARGHEFGDWMLTTAATCTEKGIETRYCSACEEAETRDVDALGHTPVTDAAVAATCTESGLTEGSHCSKCGEALIAQEVISALGHDFGEWTVTTAATCTEKGVETRCCSRCEASEIRELAALGHDFQDGICTRCGAEDKPPVQENPFVDVRDDAWYCDAVLWAYYHTPEPVTKGTDDTHFSPDEVCSRGQVVTFLWRLAGSPEPSGAVNPFVDVVNSGECSYYYKAILWAYETGVTKGVDETHFDPFAEMTRGQLVTFLWRATGSPDTSKYNNPFADVTNSGVCQYYYDGILWAAATEITKGVDDTHFEPNLTVTRSQVVTFLSRYAD